jgi:tRNA pseudouridine13 synthase
MTYNTQLEKKVGIQGFFLDFPGIGGIIKKHEEDFKVNEILPTGEVIDEDFNWGPEAGGLFYHFILWKRGLDTYSALKEIARQCGYIEKDFGFAGLKDARAETFQRISVWGGKKECLESIDFPNLKIINPIRQKFSIQIGDLLGNQFKVTIREPQRSISSSEIQKFCFESESRGFLNFFGLQRFGSLRPILHEIGRFLLRGEYFKVLDTYIGKTSDLENLKVTELRLRYRNGEPLREIYDKFPRWYSFERRMLKGLEKRISHENIVSSLPKYFLRLAVSAYQSFCFNRLLSSLFKDQSFSLTSLDLPIIGYNTNLTSFPRDIRSVIGEYLSTDDLGLNSFKQKRYAINAKGTTRPAIVRPQNVSVTDNNDVKNTIKVTFSLLKGSYGTIFLREILRNHNPM